MKNKVFDVRKLRFTFWLSSSLGLALVLLSLLPIERPTRLGEICAIDASGSIISTKVVDGTLSRFDGAYFVQKLNTNNVLLSRCGKGGCGPVAIGLLEGRVGLPVHVEYCGKRVAGLAISGVEVYLLTQNALNSEASASRNGKTVVGLFLLFFGCCFGLLSIRT